MNRTKRICITALGIALYVALSMALKIPIIGHISLDLGYIVFAVYTYRYGWVSGTIVGMAGCALVSVLTTGMFPIGWMLGQLLIGSLCGNAYTIDDDNRAMVFNMVVSCVAIFLGIAIVKTGVECVLYSIPLAVKAPKNLIACIPDGIMMCAGIVLARYINRVYPCGGG